MAITALPALDRTSATFKTELDTFFLTSLPAFSTQAEAARVEINSNSVIAAAAQVTAQAAIDAGLVNAAANAATATTKAGEALASAAEAAASAASIAGGPVASINAQTGALTLKTIGGASLLGAGDIVVATDGGATETSSAVDKTLTAASTRVQAVTMTAADKSVVLPDATTLNLGGALFVVKNTGSLSVAIRDSAGSLITMATAGQTVLLYLTNKSTAAGTWAFGAATQTQLSGALFNGTVTTAVAATSDKTSVAALSDTQALVVFRNATSQCCACTLNISSGVITPGAVLVVNATGYNSDAVGVTMLSATQAIVVYGLNGTTINACTLTVSGTTVTAGADLAITAGGAEKISVSTLSSAQAIVVYGTGVSYLRARTLNVSGTTVTAGAELAVNSVASTNKSVAALSATQAVVAYQGTSNYMYARTLDVSGTTVTAGAELAINAVASAAVSVAKLTTTKALVAYKGTGVQACTLNVSGTTVTAGAVLTISVTASNHMSVAALSAGKCLAAHQGVSGYTQVSAIDISGTTASNGVTQLILNAVSSTYQSVAPLSGTRAIAAYVGTSSYLQTAIIESAL